MFTKMRLTLALSKEHLILTFFQYPVGSRCIWLTDKTVFSYLCLTVIVAKTINGAKI